MTDQPKELCEQNRSHAMSEPSRETLERWIEVIEQQKERRCAACDFEQTATLRDVAAYLRSQASQTDELTALRERVAELESDLKRWKPMTPEEAERALDEAVAEPISDER